MLLPNTTHRVAAGAVAEGRLEIREKRKIVEGD
jgi:hypothetical protein